jgi:hypothetical protein
MYFKAIEKIWRIPIKISSVAGHTSGADLSEHCFAHLCIIMHKNVRKIDPWYC